jgi:hypothetical protein
MSSSLIIYIYIPVMLNSPSKAFPLKSRGLPLQLEYSKIKAIVNRVEHAKKHSLNDRLLQ